LVGYGSLFPTNPWSGVSGFDPMLQALAEREKHDEALKKIAGHLNEGLKGGDKNRMLMTLMMMRGLPTDDLLSLLAMLKPEIFQSLMGAMGQTAFNAQGQANAGAPIAQDAFQAPASSSGGGAPTSSPSGGAAGNMPVGATGAGMQPLTGNDQAMAGYIDKYLADHKSPAAGMGAGAMMVDAGKKYGVDPLILLSIFKHETVLGTAGVGMQKGLGVTAYDSNPSNSNPAADGMRNQIYKGAETFAKLRAENGGVGANASIDQQIAMTGRRWATDPGWASKVTAIYKEIAAGFKPSGGMMA
jgi:hypothetical protein